MARTVVYVTSVLLLCNSILMATSLGVGLLKMIHFNIICYTL